MTRRDDIVRAAVYAYPADADRETRLVAARAILDLHRLAPLLELDELLRELRVMRRELLLARARIAALEVRA